MSERAINKQIDEIVYYITIDKDEINNFTDIEMNSDAKVFTNSSNLFQNSEPQSVKLS